MPKVKNIHAVALQLDNLPSYQKNLDKLLEHIDRFSDKELIVAPEVCLTDYDYSHIEEAVKFSQDAIEILKEKIDNQIVVLTVLSRRGDKYTNDAVVIHNHKVVYRQSKHKLFLLGEEDKYLEAGSQESIMVFEIDGIKYGLLICFELRFKNLWSQLEGADVILLPSQWGMPRKRHLEILSQALAIINQCYVVVANSSKETMASSSAIYSPNGGVVIDDMKESIEAKIDFGLIELMRRYIVVQQ